MQVIIKNKYKSITNINIVMAQYQLNLTQYNNTKRLILKKRKKDIKYVIYIVNQANLQKIITIIR